ncbi:RNA polymerase sigma factor [Caulobacter sp.]|jgi:RNA polymerase sigma-70 factor (ECF subfamily)|uniref:RNA polymerase sigma factor n=1 Tax=Caulobacter sp. TaxID=78 RepID=UPI0025B9316F|nr:RNA polymerase sigma factor [Caulobacter sp.]MBQ1560928.1 RNA polymerase sigma factor [Caulobacter sp.]
MDPKQPRVATQPEGGWDERDDLDQLYRRYAPWLSAMLRRRFGRGIEADADDLVQETYARLAPHDPAEIRKPQALLMRVASNLAKDLIRRRAVRARHAEQRQIEPEADLAPATALDLVLVKEAILAIPEPYRDVFVLSRFYGLTYEQIATRCGLSVKSVEWRLARALALGAAAQSGPSGNSGK